MIGLAQRSRGWADLLGGSQQARRRPEGATIVLLILQTLSTYPLRALVRNQSRLVSKWRDAHHIFHRGTES
jgi:hypothetical protein